MSVQRLQNFRALKQRLASERQNEHGSPAPSGLSDEQYQFLYNNPRNNCVNEHDESGALIDPYQPRQMKKRGRSAVVRIFKTSEEYKWQMLLKNVQQEPSLLFTLDPNEYEDEKSKVVNSERQSKPNSTTIQPPLIIQVEASCPLLTQKRILRNPSTALQQTINPQPQNILTEGISHRMRHNRPRPQILDYKKSFQKFGAQAKSIYSIPHRTDALKMHLQQKFRNQNDFPKLDLPNNQTFSPLTACISPSQQAREKQSVNMNTTDVFSNRAQTVELASAERNKETLTSYDQQMGNYQTTGSKIHMNNSYQSSKRNDGGSSRVSLDRKFRTNALKDHENQRLKNL